MFKQAFLIVEFHSDKKGVEKWEDVDVNDVHTVYLKGKRYDDVQYGRWQKNEQYIFVCSVCGCEAYNDEFGEQKLSKYCPDCGAKMDEVEE